MSGWQLTVQFDDMDQPPDMGVLLDALVNHMKVAPSTWSWKRHEDLATEDVR